MKNNLFENKSRVDTLFDLADEIRLKADDGGVELKFKDCLRLAASLIEAQKTSDLIFVTELLRKELASKG